MVRDRDRHRSPDPDRDEAGGLPQGGGGLGQDPFAGTVIVFRSRRADRIKLITWDGTGLVMVWKALDDGAFKWPPVVDGVMKLSTAQLALLLDGLDWTRVHLPRQRHPTALR